MLQLQIQNKSEVPIFQQLYQQIQTQILSQAVQSHSLLPSIRQVARELQISVIPVKAAYEMLEKDGYIYTTQGVGCFVAPLDNTLSNVRNTIASQKILQTLEYCKSIGLTNKEILQLIADMLSKDS